MKKFIYIFICFLISFNSFSQRIVQRATQSSTVADSRLMAQLNLFIPRYEDTSAANIPGAYGLDTAGQVIYTYDDENFWVRAHNPKRWVSWNTQTVLPDGVYEGGEVVYTGTGLNFFVTPAVFVLNNIVYNTPLTPITLTAADPTFDRIDEFILTSAGGGVATVVTGTPSANPQQPSLNPQTQIGRAFVTVPAASLVPLITTSVIYDENLGAPSEYNVTSTGTINANDVSNPYHLTKDLYITSLTTAQTISFTWTDTVNSAARGAVVFFVQPVNANSIPITANFTATLYYQGNPVSPTLSFTSGGLSRSTLDYQPVAFPMPRFSPGNLIFDEIRVGAVGATITNVRMDFVQYQSDLTPVRFEDRFGLQDNFANSNRFFNLNSNYFNWSRGNMGFRLSTGTPTHTISIGDDIDGVERGYIHAPDGGVVVMNAGQALSFKSGTGIYMTPNPSSGILLVTPSTSNDVRMSFITSGATAIGEQGIESLSPGVSNHLYIKTYPIGAIPTYISLMDSVRLPATTNDNTVTKILGLDADNIVKYRDMSSIGGGSTNLNIGSGFRWAVPSTNNIKTVFNSYALNWDSTTNANGLTPNIDTTLMATRAWVGSAGGATVSSFVFTDGSGFDGTVTNATTTPTLALTTTLTENRIPVIGASGALSQDAALTWDATNKRIQSYLSPPAGTATAGTSPLKFTSGTNLSAIENGAVEYNGTHLYISIGGVRYQLDQQAAAGVVINSTAITSGTSGRMLYQNASNQVSQSANLFFDATNNRIQSRVFLNAGAAPANSAPLKFTSGTLLTTAEAGAIEYNGTNFFATPTGTTRKRIAITNNATPANGQIPIGNGTDFTVSAISSTNNTMVITNGSGSITVGLNIAPQTLTTGASITWNAANGFNAILVLANTGASLSITNPVAGATYVLRITQGTGGSRTITTWPTGTKWPSGTAPVLSTAVGAIDVISFFYDGISFLGAYDKNYL